MDEDAELERLVVAEAERRAEGLRRALRDGEDRYALFRHAHSLEGLAGTLGNERLAALARDVASRSRTSARAPDAAERALIVDEVRKIGAEVDRLRRRA